MFLQSLWLSFIPNNKGFYNHIFTLYKLANNTGTEADLK